MLHEYGYVYSALGEKAQALAYYEQALPLSRQVEDKAGEATTLTSIGAIIGLLLGAFLAWVIRTNSSIPAALPASIVVTALAASAITGVAFGMLPAVRASRLDPVEALRHE